MKYHLCDESQSHHTSQQPVRQLQKTLDSIFSVIFYSSTTSPAIIFYNFLFSYIMYFSRLQGYCWPSYWSSTCWLNRFQMQRERKVFTSWINHCREVLLNGFNIHSLVCRSLPAGTNWKWRTENSWGITPLTPDPVHISISSTQEHFHIGELSSSAEHESASAASCKQKDAGGGNDGDLN